MSFLVPSFDNLLVCIHSPRGASEKRKNNLKKLKHVVENDTVFDFIHVKALKIDLFEHFNHFHGEFPFLKNFKPVEISNVYSPYPSYDIKNITIAENISFPSKTDDLSIYLSIFRAMSDFIKTEKDFFLFIEDDNLTTDNFEIVFKGHMENINFDFDVMFVGTKEKYFSKYDPTIHNIGNEVFCKPYFFNEHDAMIFSRAGVEKFINIVSNYPLCYPLNLLLLNGRSDQFDIPIFNTFAIKPYKQQLFFSDENEI